MFREAFSFATIAFTLFFTGGARGEICDQDELMRCAKPLPGLSSPADLSIALDRDELENSCTELQASIRCINNYTDRCMSVAERRRFRSMYEGASSVMDSLCQRGVFQDDYLRHAACIKGVKSQYEACSRSYEVTLAALRRRGDADRGRDPEAGQEYLRTVCCSFQEYLLCSEQTVQRTCGDEAAVFTGVFLKRMSSNIIKNYCLEYRGQECAMASTASTARAQRGWPLLSGVSGALALLRLYLGGFLV